MTITIELTSEEEARLRQKAERQGQAPEGIVRSLVHQGLFAPTEASASDLMPVSDEAQEALLQRLLETGQITQRPVRPLGPPPPPIQVRGRPVSETIIEERR